eukprot:gene3820-59979_t
MRRHDHIVVSDWGPGGGPHDHLAGFRWGSGAAHRALYGVVCAARAAGEARYDWVVVMDERAPALGSGAIIDAAVLELSLRRAVQSGAASPDKAGPAFVGVAGAARAAGAECLLTTCPVGGPQSGVARAPAEADALLGHQGCM